MIILSWLLSCVFVSAVAVLWAPIVADLWHFSKLVVSPSRNDIEPPQTTQLLFLVPAHDEELLLGDCVRSLANQGSSAVRVETVVIADNCSDRTAEVAREAGVRVLERTDSERRGKPYALDWAFQQLDLSVTDAVVIVDADARVDAGFSMALARCGPLNDIVVQPYNGVENRDDTALTRMAAVQSEMLHGLAFPLKARTGITMPLSAGMTLGTSALRRHGWQAFSIGEDFELYVLWTLKGVRFKHASDAFVFAQEARDTRQGGSQRTRWMAGRLFVLRRYLGEVLRASQLGIRQRLDLIGEMTVTALGPAMQAALTVFVAMLAWISRVPGGRILALVALLSLSRLIIYLAIAVARDPAPWRTMLAFLRLPSYVIWRVYIGLRSLFVSGTGTWVRTSRHGRGSE